MPEVRTYLEKNKVQGACHRPGEMPKVRLKKDFEVLKFYLTLKKTSVIN